MEKHFPKIMLIWKIWFLICKKELYMIFWPKNSDMFNDILAQKIMIFLPKIINIFFKNIIKNIIIIVKNIVIFLEKYCYFWLTSKISI